MRRTTVRSAVLWLSAVGLLGACGGVPEQGEDTLTTEAQALIAAPPLPLGSFTTYASPLAVGGAVQASAGLTPGYDGYKLTVAAHTQVQLEVTHLGSSMGLDTGLFVYGPKDSSGSYGNQVLFQDDDSGYGELSKVSLATLDKAGEYLAVVGWNNAAGKQYRLQASCVGGACVPNPQPASASQGLTLVEAAVDAGLQATLANANTYREDMFSYLRKFDFAWPYSTFSTVDAAAAAVLSRTEYAGYRTDLAPQTFAYADLQARMYWQFQPLHPALLATYADSGEPVQVKSYYRFFQTGPNGDNWRTLNVIFFPRSFHVIVYEQTGHEI
ncbi:hypothetical protein D7V97_21335 [Corallococcus sp. CA053C]|uniref:hypothetical protein n=1 Tax=Corallococcus sp. CA053C TaxID=2316732 RepID=UPI000EA09B47|nr:hypothetical protein [Corallococcus sp. CA053C]RKH07424.1 hypothetical protein D7V97_21335 [Corallococcus sp. CA053C]